MADPTVAPELEFRIELERSIDAGIDDVFEALLEELGPENKTPDGNSLSMKLEPFPGGRWYRDLGDDNGHLWGHVQAIKRPALLELTGPLFMSAAVGNNVQYRLAESDGKTTLRMVHAAFGPIPDHARENMPHGWNSKLDRIRDQFA